MTTGGNLGSGLSNRRTNNPGAITPGAITRGMILAAGLGTRFKPWTDRHPKALAMVNGKSLLQRNIEYLQGYGIREVIVNVHHFAEQIEEAIRAGGGWGSDITISDERQEVLETGGGLKKAAWWLNAVSPNASRPEAGSPNSSPAHPPFLLINVDILTDLDLSAFIHDHIEHRPLATLAVTERKTSRYFLFDEQQELCGWRNIKTGEERLARPSVATPHPSAPLIQKAFSGIHIIEPSIFPLMQREGKFSMVDIYLDLAATQKIRGFDHSHSKLIDVGKPESVGQAEQLFP
jgi:MurNAc alpha-1-phosphate uridylyltransferase